jgi:ATP synthase protein I
MAKSASGGGDNSGKGEPDFRDIKKRLDTLGGKLDQTKKDDAAQEYNDAMARARGKAMGFAFRLATELVAGVFVGGAIGWFLDKWLGTAPILLIVFLLLGIAAGLLNSVRAAQRMQKEL